MSSVDGCAVFTMGKVRFLDGRSGLTLCSRRLQLERYKICSGRFPSAAFDERCRAIDCDLFPRW